MICLQSRATSVSSTSLMLEQNLALRTRYTCDFYTSDLLTSCTAHWYMLICTSTEFYVQSGLRLPINKCVFIQWGAFADLTSTASLEDQMLS